MVGSRGSLRDTTPRPPPLKGRRSGVGGALSVRAETGVLWREEGERRCFLIGGGAASSSEDDEEERPGRGGEGGCMWMRQNEKKLDSDS